MRIESGNLLYNRLSPGGNRRSGGQSAAASGATAKSPDGKPLTDEQKKKIEELKQTDQKVKAHEMAHKSVGGDIAGGISYSYTKGPDGQNYATGGEVPIDTSEIPGKPQATIQKAQKIRAAAMAPAEPSGQDQAVAAKATQMETKARSEAARQSGTGQSAPASQFSGMLKAYRNQAGPQAIFSLVA